MTADQMITRARELLECGAATTIHHGIVLARGEAEADAHAAITRATAMAYAMVTDDDKRRSQYLETGDA